MCWLAGKAFACKGSVLAVVGGVYSAGVGLVCRMETVDEVGVHRTDSGVVGAGLHRGIADEVAVPRMVIVDGAVSLRMAIAGVLEYCNVGTVVVEVEADERQGLVI